jgi:NAD(P)-dependent dehydrogenase (short-subunit alcohol dehydrogenase family)
MDRDTQPSARTVVLVGATSGIGRAAALQLGRGGHRLLLVGRDRRRGEDLAASIGRPQAVFIRGDVSTLSGIEAVVTEVRSHTDSIDTLINNAGVMLPKRRLTDEGFELNFAVHHLAPFSMTSLLLPLLENGDGRIVNTNSEGHRAAAFSPVPIDIDFEDLQTEHGYATFVAYARTKLANLLFTYEFHRRMPGLTMVAVHPGMARTRLVRSMHNPGFWLLSTSTRMFLMSPARGARPLVTLATEPSVLGGRYYNRTGPASSSPASMSRTSARRLWDVTERLRGPFVRAQAQR